ncbi:transposase [Microbulbifer sp. TRSA007]|uniref:transposase n=1 Tax=Microbulbifer sp. TRSA007 TaxID=3243384 RepID=UPI0040390070
MRGILGVHRTQLFYNLSDPAMENTLYEIESMHNFSGLILSGPFPDDATILNFLLARVKLARLNSI